MKIIHLKRAKMEVTPFGGLLLVHDFIRNIGLEAFVKDRFPPPGSNRGRSPWQFILQGGHLHFSNLPVRRS
ncbi:MAG: hypothetical protein J7K51_01525 [Thermotogae bacterium]|nr:hypothetical protein [Thermotogota bacterium]